LDINVIAKVKYPHQAPIKSLKLIVENNDNKLNQSNISNIYLVAGSYDQVISISKINFDKENTLKIETNKLSICLAELNGIDGYHNKIEEKLVIFAVGQGLENFEIYKNKHE